MPKSINTPSNATTNTPAAFKAGDIVLCPSLSPSAFVLTDDPYGKRNLLTISFEGTYFYYDKNGYLVRSDSTETDDFQPSLFHDTPANRQAVNALFGTGIAAPKVIDTTKADDKEVILLSAFRMTNLADDIKQAADTLDDIGKVLGLIHYETVEGFTARSLARLAHESADTWSELLYCSLDKINNTLAKTSYGKVGE